MKRRRVKITGIGPVTPAGIGRERFELGIVENVSRIRKFKGLDAKYGHFVAAYIDDFEIEQYFPRCDALRGAARHTLFAAVGAKLAIADAGVTTIEAKRLNPAFVAGACVMDFEGIGRTIESVLERGSRGALAKTIFTTNTACIPAVASAALGIDCRTITVNSACASGLDAVGHGARLVAAGESDFVVCGGTDAPLLRCPLVELRAAGLTPSTFDRAEQINRPFDLWRTTGVVSEGACMFVLEPETSPRRGYGFVTGYAYANDYDSELCGGMVDAMRLALAEAKLHPCEIDSISAWGPGHKLVDLGEAKALQTVFGSAFSQIPSYSIKGAIGNPLGGAPAIQVAAAALAQRNGVMPPTVNFEYPDPDCRLNVSSRARVLDQCTTLINAHGLSGVNASLVLTQ